MIRVIVDTREQDPFTFVGVGDGSHLKRAALKTGDYCLEGDREGLVIERKSVRDLFGTLTRNAERFKRELDRLALCVYPIVLVEGTAQDIEFAAWSGANGPRVLRHLLALCVLKRIVPIFCEGRRGAERMAWQLLHARQEMCVAQRQRLA